MFMYIIFYAKQVYFKLFYVSQCFNIQVICYSMAYQISIKAFVIGVQYLRKYILQPRWLFQSYPGGCARPQSRASQRGMFNSGTLEKCPSTPLDSSRSYTPPLSTPLPQRFSHVNPLFVIAQLYKCKCDINGGVQLHLQKKLFSIA